MEYVTLMNDEGIKYAISIGCSTIFVGLIWVAYQLGQIADVLRSMRIDGLNARVSDLKVREMRLQAALAEEDEEVEEECGSPQSP